MTAAMAAKIHSRREGFCSVSKSVIGYNGRSGLEYLWSGAFGCGRCCSRIRYSLQRDQLDLGVAARTQDFQHVHQFAIGPRAIGAEENKTILARVRHRVE